MGTPMNPKEVAAARKVPMELFPDTAIVMGALAMQEGQLKYGKWNWRSNPISVMAYIGALKRHLYLWVNGEERDPHTGVPHLSSMLSCLAIIVDAIANETAIDDRPIKLDEPSSLLVGAQGINELLLSRREKSTLPDFTRNVHHDEETDDE